MNILITGANGSIAKTLIKDLSGYNLITKSRKELNLLNQSEVDSFFQNNKIDYIIHTASVGGRKHTLDSDQIYSSNITMFDNLLRHADKVKLLFVFGSGAEFKANPGPYGLSKVYQTDKIRAYHNVINLRLYGCFGLYEEPQRFFKNNINKYKRGETLGIDSNIKMDFFYDRDISRIIESYINNLDLPKEIDLVYNTKYTLSELALFINNLDLHKVDINIKKDISPNYISYRLIPLPVEKTLIGLKQGLKELYDQY